MVPKTFVPKLAQARVGIRTRLADFFQFRATVVSKNAGERGELAIRRVCNDGEKERRGSSCRILRFESTAVRALKFIYTSHGVRPPAPTWFVDAENILGMVLVQPL